MRLSMSLTAMFLLALTPAVCALAQVNHCVTPEGRHIYTDQGCNAFNAYRANDPPPDFSAELEELPENGSTAASDRVCAKELEDLEKRLREALAGGDPGELARFIQWDGASRYTVDQLTPALEQISQRPLRELRIIFDFDESNWREIRPAVEIDQVEPALEGGGLVSRFRLLQFEGCWWMTF